MSDRSGQPTDTKVIESRTSTIPEESNAISREQHVVKAENTVLMLPLVPAIMEVHISEQFVPPQFKMYDGSTDTEDHIKTFTNRMTTHTRNDAI